MSHYLPPKIWEMPAEGGSRFATVNRPSSGPTFQSSLPRGTHPIQLYSMHTPNGIKISIMLEELKQLQLEGAEYDAHLIDISKGDQFSTGFCEINPNSKIPAIVDVGVGRSLPIFESGAILVYLAEKFDRFLPAGSTRSSCMSWLFWQVGSTPYLGGGFGHFYHYADEKLEYPIDRYAMEVKRLMHVLDSHLQHNEFMCGSQYSIADIAIWPWFGVLALEGMYEAAEFLQVHGYPHLRRWARAIGERPAVVIGREVLRPS